MSFFRQVLVALVLSLVGGALAAVVPVSSW